MLLFTSRAGSYISSFCVATFASVVVPCIACVVALEVLLRVVVVVWRRNVQ